MRNPFRRRLPVVRDPATSILVGDVRYDPRSAAVLERVEGHVAFRGISAGFSRIRAMFRGSGEPQAESRAVTSVPWSVGAPSMSSVTQERALRLVPVYAAVRLIADTVSTLPLKSYRETGDERQPMAKLPQLFQIMDDAGTLLDWLHRCMTSLLLRGNAYGLITERDGMGFPTVIQWLSPDDVHCDDQNPWAPVWYWRGRYVPSEDFVHIPWFTVAGKTEGLSPIEAYAATVNVGVQAQSYASGWFDNGGVPPGTFKNTAKTVSVTESDEIKDRLVRAIQSRKPIVYGSDWDYNPISISPEQAQFVETARLTASQIAAIYGLPPEMIGGEKGGSYTYSSPEQNALQLSTLTFRSWLVKLERKFSSLLPMRQQIKFNADAIVRADLASRMNAYQVARNIGLRSIDELRALEDLPPLPNGQGQSYAPPQPVVAQPVSSRNYNPHQMRDPDGTWGDGIPGPQAGYDLIAKAEGTFGTVAMSVDDVGDVQLSFGGHEFDLGSDEVGELSDALDRLAVVRDSGAGEDANDAAKVVDEAWFGYDQAHKATLYGSGLIRVDFFAEGPDPYSLDLDPPDGETDDVQAVLDAIDDVLNEVDGTRSIRNPHKAVLGLYARQLGPDDPLAGLNSRKARDRNQLKNYWLHGEGAAKWSTFDELYDHLKKHVPPGKAKRIAASWFHARYGYWPGSDKNRVAHGKKPRGKRVGPG